MESGQMIRHSGEEIEALVHTGRFRDARGPQATEFMGFSRVRQKCAGNGAMMQESPHVVNSYAIASTLGRSGRCFWRRGSESNRRIKVLQTLALPLGYRAPKEGYIRKIARTTLPSQSERDDASRRRADDTH